MITPVPAPMNILRSTAVAALLGAVLALLQRHGYSFADARSVVLAGVERCREGWR